MLRNETFEPAPCSVDRRLICIHHLNDCVHLDAEQSPVPRGRIEHCRIDARRCPIDFASLLEHHGAVESLVAEFRIIDPILLSGDDGFTCLQQVGQTLAD